MSPKADGQSWQEYVQSLGIGIGKKVADNGIDLTTGYYSPMAERWAYWSMHDITERVDIYHTAHEGQPREGVQRVIITSNARKIIGIPIEGLPPERPETARDFTLNPYRENQRKALFSFRMPEDFPKTDGEVHAFSEAVTGFLLGHGIKYYEAKLGYDGQEEGNRHLYIEITMEPSELKRATRLFAEAVVKGNAGLTSEQCERAEAAGRPSELIDFDLRAKRLDRLFSGQATQEDMKIMSREPPKDIIVLRPSKGLER